MKGKQCLWVKGLRKGSWFKRKLPDCLPRENGLGESGFHSTNPWYISLSHGISNLPSGNAFGTQTVKNRLLEAADLSKAGVNMKGIGVATQTVQGSLVDVYNMNFKWVR